MKFLNRKLRLRLLRLIARFFPQLFRVRPPKTQTPTEEAISSIFLALLRSSETTLLVDIETSDHFIINDKHALFISLERDKIQIINSVFGWDLEISETLFHFLHARFRKELTKRRQALKTEALSKQKHSLQQTANRLCKQY